MKSLGVIGGLGPMASAYFLELVIQMTDAKTDQDHLDVILFDRPAVPDRTAYILGKSQDSPLPSMMATARTLESLGVANIAVTCITSHHFFKELAAAVKIPLLNIVRETAGYLKARGIRRAGILATSGTVTTRLFQDALEEAGLAWEVPSPKGQAQVMDLIYNQVKAGKPADLEEFGAVSQELRDKGCESLILGCTELSLIKRDHPIGPGYLDALEVLAAACLRESEAPVKAAWSDLLKERPMVRI
jgi:aspartate racemase